MTSAAAATVASRRFGNCSRFQLMTSSAASEPRGVSGSVWGVSASGRAASPTGSVGASCAQLMRENRLSKRASTQVQPEPPRETHPSSCLGLLHAHRTWGWGLLAEHHAKNVNASCSSSSGVEKRRPLAPEAAPTETVATRRRRWKKERACGLRTECAVAVPRRVRREVPRERSTATRSVVPSPVSR